MKWAVVVFPGSNCDEDAANAIRTVTGDEVDLVWHQERDLSSYQAIILPGGFSYGDYLRSGALARFSPAMAGVVEAASAGRLVVGICNGFQILTEAGLLPGGLLRNDHLEFRCAMTELVVQNTDTPFTAGYTAGQTIRIPIAHGEGRYHADEDTLNELEQEGRVIFTYENNPNGSVRSIAGVMNRQKNVLGLMPHPERAIASWMLSKDGIPMFESMKRYVEEGVHAR